MSQPARRYAGQSATERHDQRHEQLLEAGLEVFAARGWAGAKVTDLCREAGLSTRYFYEVVGSREQLFLAVVARVADQVNTIIQDGIATAGNDPAERAEVVLTDLADYFAGDPRTIRVALMETLATEEFRRARRDLVEAFSDLTSRLLRPLRALPPRTIAEKRALAVNALLLTGGIIEGLIAWENGGGPLAPTDLPGHLRRLYVAVAQV